MPVTEFVEALPRLSCETGGPAAFGRRTAQAGKKRFDVGEVRSQRICSTVREGHEELEAWSVSARTTSLGGSSGSSSTDAFIARDYGATPGGSVEPQ